MAIYYFFLMKRIAQGAEARLYLDKDLVVKDRFAKRYRHAVIDKNLRKFRTRREAKILEKLTALGFPCPKLIESDDKKMFISMQNIKGKRLRDVLEKNPVKLSTELGKKIAFLHKNNIIHGDLTTSNMILAKELYFIDFGLSFFSHKIEDKAVDLHLLRQALESKHYKIWKKCFDAAIRAYKKDYPEADLVLKRLEIVEKRGRYKGKN